MSQWFNDISVQDLQTGIVNMPDYWDAIASKKVKTATALLGNFATDCNYELLCCLN